jgi:small subunit ribosomal protein S8e
MVIIQARSKRKQSGTIYKSARRKRNYELGSMPTMTKLGEKKIRFKRTRGNNLKSYYLQADKVNLFDKKTKTYSRVEITAITENEANRNFIRRNVITKGTVITTPQGKAKITSRPGQHATMNAVLLD